MATISLGAFTWLHRIILQACSDTTHVQLPVWFPCHCWSYVPSRTRDSFNAFLPQEPCGPSLPMIITVHLATPGHALRPLHLVVMQQFYADLHVSGHLVMECCTKTTLSNDNLHNLTACWQIISEHPSHFKNSGLPITEPMFQHSQECGISCHENTIIRMVMMHVSTDCTILLNNTEHLKT